MIADPETLRSRGYTLVMVGIVLVILARGCESIGSRNVNRLNAKASLAVADFEQDREEDRLEVQAKIDALREGELDEGARKKIEENTKKLDELRKEEIKDRAELEREDWNELRHAAATASFRNATWSYWREWLFLIGAICLAVGVVSMAVSGPGPERWIGLVILAIIVFGLFVVGAPWAPSIGNLLR
jgi:hypothetical protein